AAVKSGTFTKVQGNKLLVAAPPKIAKASATVKPPAVKAKVSQPKIEKGWAGVPDRTKLEQKIKTENPKNVPRPTRAAAREAASPPPALGTSPAGAVGGPAASPGPRGKRGRVAPGATVAPFERGRGRATSETVGAQPNESPQVGKENEAGVKELEAERGKARGKPGALGTSAQPQLAPSGPPMGGPSTGIERSPVGAEREYGRPGKGKAGMRQTPLEQTGSAPGAPEATQPQQGRQKGRFERGTPS